MSKNVRIKVTINGRPVERVVNVRLHLADFLRQDLRLTGTHLGCEHGVCGACTVIVDGEPVRSCLMLAVQADGSNVRTIEGVALSKDLPHPVQTAFKKHHALQCGFCTPGVIATAVALLEQNPVRTDDELREAISGHICRCTGYQQIMDAVREAADQLARERLQK
jgi:carbon-monoxide dehydrogenase small subunit